jgi:hypothetical protein
LANYQSKKHYEQLNKYGWPVFSKAQTDNRLALCKQAICQGRKYVIRFKRWYNTELDIQKHAKLRTTSRQEFTEILEEINQFGWGGIYCQIEQAIEGGFYPFVRCSGNKPIDTGAIWIGTRHDFPLIYINNTVADWICPYTKSGNVMTEPFDTLPQVVQNWHRLSNRKLFPSLRLQPLPA